MKILHLTDFHYRNDHGSKTDQNKLVNSICETLKEERIDLIFFTGDLVNKGNSYQDFADANQSFLQKIAIELNLSRENIIICAGNHDVNRDQELQAIQSEFDKIQNSNDLDSFITSQNGKQFEASLANQDNYLKFQDEFYDYVTSESATNRVEKLYSIHKRTLNGKKVGIATINTAWRCKKSDSDRGNLFYPCLFMKKIVTELNSGYDFKIILMHHPLSDLTYWNGSELEDQIHSDFHMMFSGHVHKRKNGTYLTDDEGIFCAVSPATLSLSEKDAEIGITIYDIDLETYQVEIDAKMYNKSENTFYHKKDKQTSEIPLHGAKKDQNDLRKKLRNLYNEEISRANDLFISFTETGLVKPFLELFTTPILKNKSRAEIANKQKDVPNITLETIENSKSNFVIYGKDKSGKTSLLYKLLLNLFSSYSIQKTIPFYIDAAKYKSASSIDFTTILARYFQLSKSKVENLLEKQALRVLIDNYDPENSNFNELVISYFKSHINISFVLTTEETIIRPYEDLGLMDFEYEDVYIHEISRNEVRTLTNKWPSIPKDKKEEILDKISQIFQQLNMPMNYWTVSLFLWIFEKTNQANFHNNFELIQLYVDNLLDRKRLALDKSLKLDYEDFKTFLGELAYEFIMKYKDNTYSATYLQLVDFAERYRNNNIRFVIPIKDIVDLIIDKGILKRTIDDRYTFRLNGVFEYFLAFYMKDNPEFKDQIIKDSHYYLSFSNELELYSGFNKKDKSFVGDIFNRTQNIFQPVNELYNGGRTKDQILLEKISEVFDITIPMQQLAKSGKVTLSPEKQDKLIEEFKPIEDYKAEVTEKKFYDTLDRTSENLEKSLFILSRVFRNSSINDDRFNNEIVDFILDSACNLGFLLIDEANQSDDLSHSDVSNDEDEKLLMKLMTNFMPLLVQTFLFDALAQNNLERIFLKKIDELKKEKDINQFKLLIIYFILIDLDVKSNKKYIDDVIAIIDLGMLKQTIVIKLYTYLMFKAHNQPEFEKFLRERIQKQTAKINKSGDFGPLHQSFEHTKKIALLKNRKK